MLARWGWAGPLRCIVLADSSRRRFEFTHFRANFLRKRQPATQLILGPEHQR